MESEEPVEEIDYSELQGEWDLELAAAKKNLETFKSEGERVIKEYLGEGGGARLNLYYADVQTKKAALSGEPKITARRRHADAHDDTARISALMIERLLNTDVERESDGFRRSLNHAKGDWQMPGLGQIRMRYVVSEEDQDDGTGNLVRVKAFEDVETDHVNWQDFLWSPCRTWDECRWVAFGLDLSEDALHARFDEVLGDKMVDMIPLSSKQKDRGDSDLDETLARARVWEVWDKTTKRVLWLCEGYTRVLDVKDDPLGLPGFFPCPEPLAYNVTTTKYVPRAWYYLAEDLYKEAHNLTARIRALVKSIKVVGAYSSGNEGLQRVLDDACDNEMIGVTDLATLMGKDIGGAMWFLPIEPQVRAVMELVQQRNLVRSDIAEVLGLSDIMRGQQAVRVTATTDRIKARAFSMRAQTEQDEFARFASDAQRIRAFIIATQFDPKTIVERSNVESALPDLKSQDPQKLMAAQMQLQQAVELLKADISQYRIEVAADSLSMTDLDAIKQESLEFMTATAEFFQRWTPLMKVGGPVVAQFALELYQQFAATMPGASRFEGIIDRAVADLKQQANAPKPPPPPDPKVMAEKAKAEATVLGAKVDAQKAGMELQTATAKHQMTMQEMQAEMALKRQEVTADAVSAVVGGPMAGIV